MVGGLGLALLTWTLVPIGPGGVAIAAGPPAPGANAAAVEQLTTPQLLDRAVARGDISQDDRLRHLAAALYLPALLPDEFRSDVGWSGTAYVGEVRQYLDRVLLANRTADTDRVLVSLAIAAATVCDNEDGPSTSLSANFVVNHGAIGGGLDIGAYTTALEQTFTTEVTGYGWAEPPVLHASGLYPVQVVTLGGGLYGYVTNGGSPSTGFVGDNPNTAATETDSFASCMVLNDNFALFPEGAQAALDATVAHEFVHSIQNGYGDPGTREDAMWYESTASYMEDEVFDSSNSNYFYLWPDVGNSLGEWPNNGNPGGVSQYSNFVFFRHLAEHHGGANLAGGGEDVVQHTWERIAAGDAALTALDTALTTAGTNLAGAFHEYAIAVRFSAACGTAGYVAPYCFEEGADYVAFAGGRPDVQGTIAAVPGVFDGSIRDHHAANFVDVPTGSGPFRVVFSNLDVRGQLRASIACDTGSAITVRPFASVLGPGSATTINSFDPSGCARATIVVTNGQRTSGNPSSTPQAIYRIELSTPAGPTPPSVTVEQAGGQDDPTSASPVAFTATFSEAVAGFGNDDVVVGGTAGATTVAVSGGPSVYQLLVSGMTTSGTVTASISAGRATSVATGAGNAASTSVDGEVAYVAPTNGAPSAVVIGGACPAGDETVSSLRIAVVDPDGDVITVALRETTNVAVLPPSGIDIAGSGDERTVTLTPVTGAAGTSTVTLDVGDGSATTGLVFRLIVGTARTDTVNGTVTTDVILGLAGTDKLNGNAGNDLLCGGSRADRISGGLGDDVLDGGDGNDTLLGNVGRDVLLGSDGNDRLTGGAGPDHFSGGAGRDVATDAKAREGDVVDPDIP